MPRGGVGDRDAIGPTLPREAPPEVVRWLDENPPRRTSWGPPAELVEGVVFGVWGVVEAAIFVLVLAYGGSAILHATATTLLLTWILALILSAAGAWTAFWMASEFGSGVTTEWRE